MLQSITIGKPAKLPTEPAFTFFVVTISGGKESLGPDIRIAA
jgi:hypothetical protein